MSKITLTNVVNLQNETTAVNTINSNSSVIQTAFDNTLSRDGTSPNTMESNLDMNGFQLLNLPAPSSASSPVRLVDIASNPTITVPPTGTSGAVVPFLNGNNTWSGTNTYTVEPTFPMPANTVLGNNTGVSANAVNLSQSQLTAMVNPFTSSLSGAAPASGGGTTNYLRADGTWSAPAASSYIPSGTGEVTRTFNTKINEFCQSITDYGAVSDVVQLTDGTISSGSKSFTSASGVFTASSVGKRIVIKGAGGTNIPLETTIASYISASSVTLTASAVATVSGVNYYWGTDSTTAIQNAITAAFLTGQSVYIPAGSYLTSSTINISGHVKIYGDGHQGDQGLIDQSQTVGKAAGWKSSIIIPPYAVNGISIATNDACILRDFGLVYPYNSKANNIAILCDSGPNSTDANEFSLIDNVFICQSDFGIYVQNWYDFTITNSRILSHTNTGIQVSPTHFTNNGDYAITNNFIGSGTASYHLAITAGGGGKIIGNKFNYGNNATAILIAPSLNTSSQIEPLIISNNSIEGLNRGIQIARQSGNTQISQVVITGNQIWPGNALPAIEFDIDAANAIYINGVVITGNVCVVAGSGSNIISLNGCQNVIVDGNFLAVGTGTATAIAQGATVSNIITGTNCKGSGVT